MVENKKKSNKHTKIFLSYAYKDTQDIACKLYFDLKESGYDVWIDKILIIEGKSREEQIEQAILESKIFIALLSPCAVRRPDGVCLDEISIARYNSKRIIPIMILNCRPPLGIYRLDWVDFQDWQNSDVRYKQSFKRLLKAIKHPENVEGNL